MIKNLLLGTMSGKKQNLKKSLKHAERGKLERSDKLEIRKITKLFLLIA